MSYWILAGALTALVTLYIVRPLPPGRVGWLIMILMPLLALALYFYLGNPSS